MVHQTKMPQKNAEDEEDEEEDEEEEEEEEEKEQRNKNEETVRTTSRARSDLCSPPRTSRASGGFTSSTTMKLAYRTVIKPGQADAAIMSLPNGSFLAVKGDGNSKHCALEPYRGAAGCVAEACRNVVAVGAEPIALVDHLQYGDPSDPEVYWAFSESIRGMADYCRTQRLPVVGGKVSFYNEDLSTGLGNQVEPHSIGRRSDLRRSGAPRVRMGFHANDLSLVLVGETKRELGGSEYYEHVLHRQGGRVPEPDGRSDRRTNRAVLKLQWPV